MKNCGQIAVAVITNKSVKEIENFIKRPNKGTKTKHLARALKHYGFDCGHRLIPLKKKPALALAKLHFPEKRNWHWVVIYKDKIYDGVWGKKDGTVTWPPECRITSYLPITNYKR